jgi:hypothetical protein
MRQFAGLALLAAIAGPALAQQPAISPSLSPEQAAAAFEDAVMNGCVAGVASGRRAGSGAFAGKLLANASAEARAQVGAASDEAVFDVEAARGVVAMKEKDGRCAVSVYGPPASDTVMAVVGKLTDQGFERLASAPSPNGLRESLTKTEGGKRLQVTIGGSEPGMPGHRSRFSVTTVTVFATP